MMLVTLSEASDHLRRDTDADDDDLILKVSAASAAVMRYLKDTSPYQTDSNGDPVQDSNGPIVLFEVRAAILLLVGEFYRHRDGEQAGEIPTQWGYGYLPRPVVALLYPLRDPTIG